MNGDDTHREIERYLGEVTAAVAALSVPGLERVFRLVEDAYRSGRTIFVCGNGGSASTASHLVVDLAKNTRRSGVVPVRALSLADHMAGLTAWANDVDYSAVFSGQLQGLVGPRDVVVGFTTSGNSENILQAFRAARDADAITVAFLGADGGKARELADAYVLAPGSTIEQQEDLHLMLAHLLTRHMRCVVARIADPAAVP
ncbi:MAG: SIS domain-containing protein [Actinobacteria bacterium]|nr:SIS domain-containing protein [Actinomycetota bacterium]